MGALDYCLLACVLAVQDYSNCEVTGYMIYAEWEVTTYNTKGLRGPHNMGNLQSICTTPHA